METVKATTEAVACTLSASELRERVEQLRTRLLDLITTEQETDDGYILGFVPGSIDTVREFVAFESECCSFITYTIDDSNGQTRLGLRGPEGTKEFVGCWLDTRASELEVVSRILEKSGNGGAGHAREGGCGLKRTPKRGILASLVAKGVRTCGCNEARDAAEEGETSVAERGTRRLLRAGTGGLIGAVFAVLLCETPLLAVVLLGIGATSELGQVSGWLDLAAMILVIASVAFIGVAIYRRRQETS